MSKEIMINKGKVRRIDSGKVQVAGIKTQIVDWSVTDRAEIFGRQVEEKRPYLLLFQGDDAKTLLERANSSGNYHTHEGIKMIAYGIRYWGESQEIRDLNFDDRVKKIWDASGVVQEVYYRRKPELEVVKVENPHRKGFLWSQLSDDTLTLSFEQFLKLQSPLEMQFETRQTYTPIVPDSSGGEK